MTRYERIWEASREISGGFGFWGGVCCHWNLKELVRAWVDALAEKGYDDASILIYGDTKDARWIVDEATDHTTYEEFKRIVRTKEKIVTLQASDPAHWAEGLRTAQQALNSATRRHGR